ncbi:MAG: putative N-acetyltransferase YafP [Candidatus Anoxychlamydiales bacterium]|nr:putative N-acetyltransferase YafP [Candidatus Anoxychlamydiales bacterium]
MKPKIVIRSYRLEEAKALMYIFYNTIHKVNIKDYTLEQVDAWAPKENLKIEDWQERFKKSNPIVAIVDEKIVGFAEFGSDGYIDCFYIHHEWIGKEIGTALMKEIFLRAKKNNIKRIFVDVSITAKPFFEKKGFMVLSKQTIIRKGVELTNYQMEKRFL